MDANQTHIHAREADPSLKTRELTLLTANVLSLFAVGLVIFASVHQDKITRIIFATLSLFTVFMSWIMVHTMYTVRYTDLYYSNDPPSGIDFNQKELPMFTDFAYVAFNIGMSYQISDTNITDHTIRITALAHSFFAYIFGTGIIATTLNLVASLLLSNN